MRRGAWHALAVAWLVLSVLPSRAQEPQADGVDGVDGVDAADFQRIEATRALETARYTAAEAACYQRFAVSSCLQDLQSQRRAMLADLRRQEAILHERQFAHRAAEQKRLSAQKALERQQKEAELKAENPAARAAEKLQAQKTKQAEHLAKAPAAWASAPASTEAPTVPTQALSAAEQAANRESYARKQAAASAKRQEIAKRLGDKEKGTAPLPLPP